MLQLLLDKLEDVQTFIESGGDVLLAIFVATLLMWMLIFERFWYIRYTFPGQASRAIKEWSERKDHESWYSLQIRRMEISRLRLGVRSGLPMISTLLALCPLLGLLGTVNGMISVFEVLAMFGNNTRAMAGGVSKAILPTMAGMAAAISGLYFRARLEELAKKNIRKLEQALTTH